MKRLFPNRYLVKYNSNGTFKILDNKTGSYLEFTQVVDILNECHELRSIYSCDINASNYYPKWQQEQLYNKLKEMRKNDLS